jgi:hypothetical protein
MSRRTSYLFTPTQAATMSRMLDAGNSSEEIAKATGRDRAAVQSRARHLGRPFSKRRPPSKPRGLTDGR